MQKLTRFGFLASALLCGCATPHAATPSHADDFGISLTVLGSQDPATQPTWYLLGPDNALRLARVVRTPQSPAPPIVRTLSHAEVEGVWSRARAVTESQDAVRVSDETACLPPTAANRIDATTLALTSGGVTRCVLVRPLQTSGTTNAHMASESLAKYLDALAESSDSNTP